MGIKVTITLADVPEHIVEGFLNGTKAALAGEKTVKTSPEKNGVAPMAASDLEDELEGEFDNDSGGVIEDDGEEIHGIDDELDDELDGDEDIEDDFEDDEEPEDVEDDFEDDLPPAPKKKTAKKKTAPKKPAKVDAEQLKKLKAALNKVTVKKGRTAAIKILQKFAKTSQDVKASDFDKLMKALKV